MWLYLFVVAFTCVAYAVQWRRDIIHTHMNNKVLSKHEWDDETAFGFGKDGHLHHFVANKKNQSIHVYIYIEWMNKQTKSHSLNNGGVIAHNNRRKKPWAALITRIHFKPIYCVWRILRLHLSRTVIQTENNSNKNENMIQKKQYSNSTIDRIEYTLYRDW